MKKLHLVLLFIAVIVGYLYNISPVSADEPIVVSRGGSITIVTTLGGDAPLDTPLGGQPILFFDETNNLFLGSNTTSSDGIAIFCWHIPYDYGLGPTLINATFRGNESLALAPCAQWIWVDIMATSNLVVTVVNSTLAPGDTLVVHNLLHDDLGFPIANATLTLSALSETISTATTNRNGSAQFNLVCNASWLQFGSNSLEVSFAGVPSSNILPTSFLFQIIFNKLESSIRLDSHPFLKPTINDTLTVTLALGASSEVPTDSSIHVLFDGYEIDTDIVNTTGHCTFHIYLSSNVSIGHHSLLFTYSGSARYTPSSLNLDFDVTTPLSAHMTMSGPLVLNSRGIFYVRTFDIIGRPIIGGQLYISEGDSILTTLHKLSPDGENQVAIPVNGSPGVHTLTISIQGNPFLYNSSIDYDVVFYSRPVLHLLNSSIQGYARPEQRIIFYILAENETGPWSRRTLTYNVSYFDVRQSLTNSTGIAFISFDAPLIEATYCVNITTLTSGFELPSTYNFIFKVRVRVPTVVSLIEYTAHPVLKEIETYLRIAALNGSALSNIELHYSWLDHNNNVFSSSDGNVIIHLPIPPESGIYRLYYQLDGGPSIEPSSGYYTIYIGQDVVLSAQGVGLVPFLTSILLSLSIVLVSIYKRRKAIA